MTLEGFPLSSQQRRAWSLVSDDRPTRAWCALRLEGRLDVEALRRAAERLVASHEILRTTFHRRPGSRAPLQVVEAAAAPSWTSAECAAAEPLAAAEELVAKEMASPFNLEQGPVLRVRLCALSESSHVLLFSLPTLNADRGTLHELARHLAESYAGTDATAGEKPIQYADYSQWQEELLDADDGTPEAARTYWRGTSALRPMGSIPFEVLRDAPPEGGASDWTLAPETLERIDAFSSAGGFSAGDFLLACWQTLLWRTTGNADVVVASVEEGRGIEELRRALGLFARALPVPMHFERDTPFSEAVRSAAGTRSRNVEWQDYFGRKEDQDSGKGSEAALPGFEYFERPELPAAGGVSFSILRESGRTEAFPVWLSGAREAAGLRLSVGADPRLPAGTAPRLAEHLRPLVAAAAERPASPAGSLPILTEAQRRRLLVELPPAAAGALPSACVSELFEAQVERSPDSTALVFREDRLTYRELNDRANSLAWLLRERGVGPDVPVGLCADRCADSIIAVLAILKAGGAYVPLNPEHPGSRLALQLSQCRSPLVLTHAKWLDKLGGFGGEKISLDKDRHLFQDGPTANLPQTAGPDHLAYVMHTSGSTGTPKGVAVRQASLSNYSTFVSRSLLGIEPDARPPLAFATVSALSADLGNTAIFPSLIAGGRLHLVENETAMEGRLFADYAALHGIDVLKIVPSHFSALLDSDGGAAILPRRFLIFGGEALSWDLVERVQALKATCEIVNHYGPTETTVGSLTHRLRPGEKRRSSATVPIGRPIANTEVFLLDDRKELVPVGVAGELYIGGAGLARGYVNQPAETSERFVPHPFSQSRAARLYRTGDRARSFPDGTVEYLGRVDDQVKIRGFRIEPGEVRAVLAAHPGVRECVVMAREDSPGEARLVAYVIPAQGSRAGTDELRAFVREQLPEHMIPAAFLMMKAFPLTPNGKVDRQALPAPELGGTERPYVAPRTGSEKIVAESWKEVLRVERVGADDNFFDLGGHSLLMTQVVSRLRKSFERDLPIRWLFETPTVAGLAGRIDAAAREDLARILDELEGLPEEDADNVKIENEPPSRA